MNIFFREHQALLKVLLAYKVDFLLVGGYAVNYYGYNRATGDMDIWLRPDNANKGRLLMALKSLEFDTDGLEVIRAWDFSQPQIFHIGEKARPDMTEFMTHISGVDFSTAYDDRTIGDIDGLELPIIHYNHLIWNKQAAGRIKDLADVEHLERIMHLRKS